MARILKWREKLLLGLMTMFFSIVAAMPLGARDTRSENALTLQFVTSANGGKVYGLELGTHRPYARLLRGSLAPVSLPLAAGAFVTMASDAGFTGAAGTAAPACTTGGGGGTVAGGTTGCHEIHCTGGFTRGGNTCETCGYGTCGVCC